MGLLIGACNEHGCVFTTDSKASFSDVTQQLYQRKDRKPFYLFERNDGVIAVQNTRPLVLSNGSSMYIEDWVEQFLRNNLLLSISEATEKMVSELKEVLERSNEAVALYVGYQAGCECVIASYEIAYHKIEKQIYRNCFLWNGERKLFPQNIGMHSDWTISDMKLAATALLQSSIELGDIFLYYNPNSGDLHTVSFATKEESK